MRSDDEIRRELDSYLEHEADENLARGMTPGRALSKAHQKLGNLAVPARRASRTDPALMLRAA